MKEMELDDLNLQIGFGREDYYCEQSFVQDSTLLSRQWQYVDHISNFDKVGDYRVFRILGESVVLVKTAEGFSAFINMCRHRGSLICLEHKGNTDKFVCPYHGWQYELDGKLIKALAAPIATTNPEQFSLHLVGLKVYEGMIFIALDKGAAPDFELAMSGIAALVEWHELGETKVASIKNYEFKANWKLVVENFLECFHCHSNHPQLKEVYSHPKLTGTTDSESNMSFMMESAKWEQLARDLGHPTGGCVGIDVSAEQFAVAFRMPIGSGKKSLSQDGQGMAPLIGQFKEYDGGETFGYFGPLLHFSLLNDHALLIRIVPESATRTNVQLVWLTAKEAQEGVDYDKKKLTWLWDTTVKQDRTAVQRSQQGFRSQYAQKGIYSDLELESHKFALWYRNAFSNGVT